MKKLTNNKESETIKMEESTFLRRHAGKILLAGGVVVSAGVYYLLKKHGMEIEAHEIRLTNVEHKLLVNTEIAVKSLKDTIAKYDFEISELIFKRDNLDQSATQNIFMNIPKLNEEIELKNKLKENAVSLLEKAIENGKTE